MRTLKPNLVKWLRERVSEELVKKKLLSLENKNVYKYCTNCLRKINKEKLKLSFKYNAHKKEVITNHLCKCKNKTELLRVPDSQVKKIINNRKIKD